MGIKGRVRRAGTVSEVPEPPDHEQADRIVGHAVILVLTIIAALVAGAIGLVVAGPPGAIGFAVAVAALVQFIGRQLKKRKK